MLGKDEVRKECWAEVDLLLCWGQSKKEKKKDNDVLSSWKGKRVVQQKLR